MSAGRRFLRLGLLVGLLLFAAAFYLYSAARASAQAVDRRERPSSSSRSGLRPREIFRRLSDERVVSPAWLAEAWYRLAESATPLQAGEYRFTRPTALSEVIARMARGRRRPAHDRRARGPDGRGDVRALLEPRHLPARRPSRKPSRTPSSSRRSPAGPRISRAFSSPTPTSSRARPAPARSSRRCSPTSAGTSRRRCGNGPPRMNFSIRDAVTLASIVQKETLLAREAPSSRACTGTGCGGGCAFRRTRRSRTR